MKYHVRIKFNPFTPHIPIRESTLCGIYSYYWVGYNKERNEFYRLDNYQKVPIDTVCGRCVRICQGHKRYGRKGTT